MGKPAERDPVRASAPGGVPSKPADGRAGCVVAVLVIVGLFAIARCGSSPSGPDVQSVATTDAVNTTDTMMAETPTPTPTAVAVEPISQASVSRGNLTAQRVVVAEGYAGAMIFSQNCYETAQSPLSWAKLDQCGAFDLAVIAASDGYDGDAGSAEIAYFEAEAAAGRYLQALTAGGEEVGKADLRLSVLQGRVSKFRPVLPAEPAPVVPEPDGLVLNDLLGEAEAPGD